MNSHGNHVKELCERLVFGPDGRGNSVLSLLLNTAEKRIVELLKPRNDAISAAWCEFHQLEEQCRDTRRAIQAIEITPDMVKTATDMLKADYDAADEAATKVGISLPEFNPHFCAGQLCVARHNNAIVLDPSTVPDVLKPLATAMADEVSLCAKLITCRDAIYQMREERESVARKLMDEATKTAIEHMAGSYRTVVEGHLAEVLAALDAPKPKETMTGDGKKVEAAP